MIIKKILPVLLFMSLLGVRASYAQETWTAPAAPGQDPSTLTSSTDVYVYNIEAEAVLSRGYNWGTKAIANQLEIGDVDGGEGRQVINITPSSGSTLRIHLKDRDSDRWFAQNDNNDANDMWSDLRDPGDRGLFTYNASANYPNAYTLTNVAKNKMLDVAFMRGGQTTLYNGKGFYDWVFMTPNDVQAGKLRAFKARKAMWNYYQALEKAGALEANADALDAAYVTYSDGSATADELRAAFRTLFLATASSIEDPVDVSYLFSHPDMAADKSLDDWNWEATEDAVCKAGEWERWHVPFTAHQTQTAPNGLYDVRFMGIYRLDGGDATAPTLTVTAGEEVKVVSFPNMYDLGGYWNVSNGSSWANCSTGQCPDQMWTASDALALDQASALAENIKVNSGSIDVKFAVTGGQQWFNWHRVIVTYKGSINGGLYKTLLAKVQEATEFVDAKTGVILASFLDDVTSAVSAASGLTANSSEEALTAALDAIADALTAADAAPTIAKFNELQALVASAQAEGINTAAAEAVVANPTTLAAVNEQIDVLVDALYLAATITLANTEGLSTTAAASVLTADPLSRDNIKDALFDLRSARKVNAQRMPDIYTGSAPAPAAGSVYLYNLGTGMFLGTGSSYNTHAAVDQVGIELELVAEGDGFKIRTSRGGGWLAKGNAATSVYVDSWNSNQVWQFLPISGVEGVYNISFDGSATNLLGYNPRTPNDNNTGIFWGSIGIGREDGSDSMNQWKIITLDERANLIASASVDNPVDVSYLIGSPSMNSQDNRNNDWTRSVSTGNYGWVDNTENHGYESWNADSFNFYQTLQNLPAGLYKVSVSGFWREGSGDNQANIVNNGGTLNHNAYLYAGDQKVMLENIASCPDFVPGIATQASVAGKFPNWPAEVFEYFETGAFKNTVEATVGADGKLTIGVAIDQKLTYGDWVVIDNFRLTYLGGASTSIEVTVGEAGYVTFVAPFDIAELPEGVEAYACQTQTDFVHLEPVTAIPAGEAVVLKNTGTYQFSPATSAVELGADNDLLASNGNVLGGANIYVLAKPEGQAVGFYPTTTGTSIPEGKGYLFIQGSNIKKFYGFDEDDATGLSNISDKSDKSDVIYNLAGQRLSKQQNQRSTYVKGVNIVDGKKILR